MSGQGSPLAFALERIRPSPADGQVAIAARANGRYGNASELPAILELAHATLNCCYAVETRSGGETACISQAGKRAILVDSENAD